MFIGFNKEYIASAIDQGSVGDWFVMKKVSKSLRLGGDLAQVSHAEVKLIRAGAADLLVESGQLQFGAEQVPLLHPICWALYIRRSERWKTDDQPIRLAQPISVKPSCNRVMATRTSCSLRLSALKIRWPTITRLRATQLVNQLGAVLAGEVRHQRDEVHQEEALANGGAVAKSTGTSSAAAIRASKTERPLLGLKSST
ncbi:hypothetical protein TYRP_011661 [Tyrophagus putrescentiae]|nr:hypothetical protein TYRP_011661 [Tyrophagus putrescentiae]